MKLTQRYRYSFAGAGGDLKFQTIMNYENETNFKRKFNLIISHKLSMHFVDAHILSSHSAIVFRKSNLDCSHTRDKITKCALNYGFSIRNFNDFQTTPP